MRDLGHLNSRFNSIIERFCIIREESKILLGEVSSALEIELIQESQYQQLVHMKQKLQRVIDIGHIL